MEKEVAVKDFEGIIPKMEELEEVAPQRTNA